jgi:hypothetical protein
VKICNHIFSFSRLETNTFLIFHYGASKKIPSVTRRCRRLDEICTDASRIKCKKAEILAPDVHRISKIWILRIPLETRCFGNLSFEPLGVVFLAWNQGSIFSKSVVKFNLGWNFWNKNWTKAKIFILIRFVQKNST